MERDFAHARGWNPFPRDGSSPCARAPFGSAPIAGGGAGAGLMLGTGMSLLGWALSPSLPWALGGQTGEREAPSCRWGFQ